MTKETIEQQATQILREEKISRPPIKSELLAEFHFGLDFDCCKLNETELAGLKIAEKKIYINEYRADELATNVGMKNFTIAHELGKAFAKLTAWFPAEIKVDSLAKMFCVSRTAMKIRLSQRELKLIYVDFNDYKSISFNERNNIKNPERHWLDFFVDDNRYESFWTYLRNKIKG